MQTKSNTPATPSKKVNFNALTKWSKVGTKRDSIYKLEILSGTEKERKAIRRKIRNTRDNMVEAFNLATKAEKLEIAKAWMEFASQVYADTSIIFEANTTDDKAATLAEFVANVRETLKK